MSLNENEKKVKKDKNYSQKTNPLNTGYCNSGQDRKRTTNHFLLCFVNKGSGNKFLKIPFYISFGVGINSIVDP